MYLLLVVGIILGLSYAPAQPGAHFSPNLSLILVVLLTLIYASLGGAVIRFLLPKATHIYIRPAYMARRALRFLLFYRGLMLGFFGFEIYGLKWPYLVNEYWGLKEWVLLDEIIILSPFLAMVMISFVATYPADKLLRGSDWRLSGYISFQVRTVLLVVLLPLFTLLGLYDLLSIAQSRGLSQVVGIPLPWIVVPFVVTSIYLFAPLALKGLWRARGLPSGPLRQRLEQTARSTGFKFRDILIWPTFGGHILTACVTGLLSRFRYVLFTDDLLASFSPQEVEAVLAHEIGHIKKRHFPFFIIFTATFITLLVLLDAFISLVMSFLGAGTKITEGAGLTGLSAAFLSYWGLLFGYISRRLERQADLYGASVVGSSVLVSALEKLALLAGLPRRYYSWRHFSIDQRIDFLRRAQEDPGIAHQFQRRLRRIVLGVVVSFFVGLLIILLLVLFGK